MDTGVIIAIVVVVLIAIALFAFMRSRGQQRAQRELENRRERAADRHRTEAAERNRQAELAEQKAQMAEAEAKRERAEAEVREQRAQMHEQGMADHELVEDHERDRFADTSATHDEPAPMRDDHSAAVRDDRPMHEPGGEYAQGREDEAAEREGRFARDEETARTDEPTTTTPRRDV